MTISTFNATINLRNENESFAGDAFMRHPIFLFFRSSIVIILFSYGRYLSLTFHGGRFTLLKKEVAMADYTDFNRRPDAVGDMNCHEPNDVTRRALLEADEMIDDPHTITYADVEEALTELNKD